MQRERNFFLRSAHLFIDLLLTSLSFYAANILISQENRVFHSLYHYFILLYLILPIWAVFLYSTGAYRSLRSASFFKTVWPVLKTVFTAGIVFIFAIFIFKLLYITRSFVLLFLSLNAVFLIAERIFVFTYVNRKDGRDDKSILIVGTGKRAREFARSVDSNKREWAMEIAGFIDIDPSKVGQEIEGKKVIGLVKNISEVLTAKQIDEVVFVCPRKWIDMMEDAVYMCEEIGIGLKIACDFYPNKTSKMHLENLGGWPLLTLMPPPHYGSQIALKRAIDIALSSIIISAVAPFFIIVALGIKLSSPGPVFFRQERCGLNGRRLQVLKFRTMVQDAELMRFSLIHLNEMSGPVFKVRNDPRVTAFGKFLRKYSLDELPQFINVLRGDMSIVGPRPPLPDEVKKYGYSQRRRLSVHPGITCLWQVSGRNKIGFSEWVKLDLEYIDKWSLALDFKIILKTIPAILRGTGV